MSFKRSGVKSLRLLRLLSDAMFYNRWLLLWALWLIYNGPHCGMRHDTLPDPYMFVAVTCCVMETVISGAMLSGSTDMPLWVYVVIGKKAGNWAGSGPLRSTSSVSPTAQRRDCLKLALRLVLSYVQMADGKLGDSFSLGQAFGQSWLRLSKAQSYCTTSPKLFLLSKKGEKKKSHCVFP